MIETRSIVTLIQRRNKGEVDHINTKCLQICLRKTNQSLQSRSITLDNARQRSKTTCLGFVFSSAAWKKTVHRKI